MSKILFLPMLTPLLVVAEGMKLTDEEYKSLHGVNKSPLMKVILRGQLHRLNKINEDKDEKIASRYIKEKR